MLAPSAKPAGKVDAEQKKSEDKSGPAETVVRKEDDVKKSEEAMRVSVSNPEVTFDSRSDVESTKARAEKERSDCVENCEPSAHGAAKKGTGTISVSAPSYISVPTPTSASIVAPVIIAAPESGSRIAESRKKVHSR